MSHYRAGVPPLTFLWKRFFYRRKEISATWFRASTGCCTDSGTQCETSSDSYHQASWPSADSRSTHVLRRIAIDAWNHHVRTCVHKLVVLTSPQVLICCFPEDIRNVLRQTQMLPPERSSHVIYLSFRCESMRSDPWFSPVTTVRIVYCSMLQLPLVIKEKLYIFSKIGS